MDKAILKTYWASVSIFIVFLGFFFIPYPDDLRSKLFPFIGVLALVFLTLAVVQTVLVLRTKMEKRLKTYLLLMAGSAIAAPVFSVLHNLVYALMVYFNLGVGDEAVFFILAIIVAPIGFIVGAIGSFLLMKR